MKLQNGHNRVLLIVVLRALTQLSEKVSASRRLISAIIHTAVTSDCDERHYEYEVTFYEFLHGNGNDWITDAIFQENALAVFVRNQSRMKSQKIMSRPLPNRNNMF
ncbi:hypothetical protein NPIL_87131 [Nephila pilipes]|uniref:Uncharacterized protein n=1 Tax=Nephila pilipes TaxID=299642 RepID=A0A8X6TIY9_NEPPI|nr:hypothetical protein NPIL_376181 [Nephila pilipes]GFT48692.1 hypothetical protein NPIL_87131 [Nephila pilipes]